MTTQEKAKEGKEGRASLREAMPAVASMVDELRSILGAERVDAAIKASRIEQRAMAAIEAERGPAAARAWLARQPAPHGRFWATEGGCEVGTRQC